jgi:hypothetical protein
MHMIIYGWRMGADRKSGSLGDHARTDVRAQFPASKMCMQTIPCERYKGSLTWDAYGPEKWHSRGSARTNVWA